MVDAPALGAGAARRGGSSPLLGTTEGIFMLNAHKKNKIDAVRATYDSRMTRIKQKQDAIMADFLDTLHQKRMAELRHKIKQL